LLGVDFDPTLRAARARGEWAWAQIYRDLAPALLGYLRARRAADPEDVAGETFLQVVRDIDGFEGGERAFRTWVFTIARHRLLDQVRYRARRPVAPAPLETLASVRALDDTEQEALVSHLVSRARRHIDQLSPDQQDVILLRLLGGLTVDEVARAVGKSRGAVKALQRRAIMRLKQEMAGGTYPSGRSGRLQG
jgi:RNA polymerase sigma-70 factor (ECF subfamily)